MQDNISIEGYPKTTNFLNAKTNAERWVTYDEIPFFEQEMLWIHVANSGSLKHFDFLFQKSLSKNSIFQNLASYWYAAPQNDWSDVIHAVLGSGDFSKFQYIKSKGLFKSLKHGYSLKTLVQENIVIASKCEGTQMLRAYIQEIKRHDSIMSEQFTNEYIHNAFLEILNNNNIDCIDVFILDADLRKKIIFEENFNEYVNISIKNDNFAQFKRLYELQYILKLHGDQNNRLIDILVQSFASEQFIKGFFQLITNSKNTDLYGHATDEKNLQILRIRSEDSSYIQALIEQDKTISNQNLFYIICEEKYHPNMQTLLEEVAIKKDEDWVIKPIDEEALLRCMLKMDSFSDIYFFKTFFEKMDCIEVFENVLLDACDQEDQFLEELIDNTSLISESLKIKLLELLLQKADMDNIQVLLNKFTNENWKSYLVKEIDLLSYELSDEFANELDESFGDIDVKYKIYEYQLMKKLKNLSPVEFEQFYTADVKDKFNAYIINQNCRFGQILESLKTPAELTNISFLDIPKHMLPVRYMKNYYINKFQRIQSLIEDEADDLESHIRKQIILDTLEYQVQAYYEYHQWDAFKNFKEMIDYPKITNLLPDLIIPGEYNLIKTLKKYQDQRFMQCLLDKFDFYEAGLRENLNYPQSEKDNRIQDMLAELTDVLVNHIYSNLTFFNIDTLKQAIDSESAEELMPFNLSTESELFQKFEQKWNKNIPGQKVLPWEYKQYLNQYMNGCQALRVITKLRNLLEDELPLLQDKWNQSRLSIFANGIRNTIIQNPIPSFVEDWKRELEKLCTLDDIDLDDEADIGLEPETLKKLKKVRFYVCLSDTLATKLLQSNEFNLTPWNWLRNSQLTEQLIGQLMTTISDTINEIQERCNDQIVLNT